MTMTPEILIVGAGISGLSMAHYCLRQGLKTLVLEREHRIGGCLHSHRLDAAEPSFWIELGAHSCFNSYGKLLGIIEDLGLLEGLQKRQRVGFRLLSDGAMKSIPSQLHFLELLVSLPRLFSLKKAGRSVAGYYGPIVGERNYKAVFAPAFDAVICQRSADFPAELLFRPKRRRKDVVRSFTLPGGLQTMADAIAGQTGLQLLTGQTLKAVSYTNNLFTLLTADGNRYTAPCLCLATPADTAAGLLQSVFPDLAGLLGRIPTVAVETLGVVVHRDALRLPPLGGIIARDDSFFSVVSRDTVEHPAYRGFTFHFKPGLLDQAGKLKRIGEVLGSGADQLHPVIIRDNRLPSLQLGHADLVAEIDRQLAGLPLALCGNYFTGLSIEDCVTRSLSEFSRLRSRCAFQCRSPSAEPSLRS